MDEVRRLYAQTGSLRKTAEIYSQNKYKDNKISRNYVKRVISGEFQCHKNSA